MNDRAVYIVLADGIMVLGVYSKGTLAHVHARTITGASVVMCQVLDELPWAVRDELGEDFDEGADTPVTEIPIDEVDG